MVRTAAPAPRRGRPFLRLLGLVLAVLAAAAIWLAATPLPRVDPVFEAPRWIGPLAIVDTQTGSVLAGHAIELRGGRIVRIAPVASLDRAARGSLRHVGNAHVVPGLWDMHGLLIRYATAIDHPLYLAHGVTRLRNILDCPGAGAVNLHPCRADKARWNRDIAAGRLLGQVVMGSGTYPVAGPAHLHRDSPGFWSAADPDAARALVRDFAARYGPTDHIKTYDGLPRASFLALMDEARRLGVEVSGHVPSSVRVAEAAAAGFRAIAHARVLPIACSSRETEIMGMRMAGAPGAQWMELALATQDAAKCAALWAELRARGTFISPTLITRYSETAPGISALARDPATLRATPGLLELIWREDVAAIEGRTPREEQLYRAYYRASAARTSEAARAGVRLLLGTDTNDAFVAPGIALHHEIALWRRAGIPAATVLQAGTVNAAAYFGIENSIGRIAPGQTADLVFVAGNPLRDMSVLRRPLAVMQAGRLYDRAALDAATASAEHAASSWRFTVHFLRDLLRNPLGFTG